MNSSQQSRKRVRTTLKTTAVLLALFAREHCAAEAARPAAPRGQPAARMEQPASASEKGRLRQRIFAVAEVGSPKLALEQAAARPDVFAPRDLLLLEHTLSLPSNSTGRGSEPVPLPASAYVAAGDAYAYLDKPDPDARAYEQALQTVVAPLKGTTEPFAPSLPDVHEILFFVNLDQRHYEAARSIGPARRLTSCSAQNATWPRPKPFFRKAIKHHGQPTKTITLDGYAASHRAVREMRADGLLPEDTKVRSSTYLNNLIEQEHRNLKSRKNVMFGIKHFRNAAITRLQVSS